jgi:3-hydroxybutyrate dehydrogenase
LQISIRRRCRERRPTSTRRFNARSGLQWVRNEEQVEAGMARVIETFGRVDILISNAGVQVVAPLVEFELAKWKRLLSIHLDGAFLTTRAALRQMYRQKSGSIIYMGSVHAVQ